MLEELIKELTAAIKANTEAIRGQAASDTAVDIAEERVTGTKKTTKKKTTKKKTTKKKIKVDDVRKLAMEKCQAADDGKAMMNIFKAKITEIAEDVYQDADKPLDDFDVTGLTLVKEMIEKTEETSGDEEEETDDLVL